MNTPAWAGPVFLVVVIVSAVIWLFSHSTDEPENQGAGTEKKDK